MGGRACGQFAMTRIASMKSCTAGSERSPRAASTTIAANTIAAAENQASRFHETRARTERESVGTTFSVANGDARRNSGIRGESRGEARTWTR